VLLLEIKEEIMHLAEEVRMQQGYNIMGLIKRELPGYDLLDF
jgi:hypothetical protein